MSSKFLQQPMAIIDLEFTTLDPRGAEIIEIGALMINQETMEVVRTFETRVAPVHLETANPDSLRISNYNEADWQGAPSLKEAMNKFSGFLGDTIVRYAGWSITLDWPILRIASYETGIELPFDYHTIDICGIAAEALRFENNLDRVSLSCVSEYLGLPPRTNKHHALSDAEQAYKVLKKLRELDPRKT